MWSGIGFHHSVIYTSIVYTVYAVCTNKLTRKLCYRKDDRAMCPTYGCLADNFQDSLTTPTATIPNVIMGF